MPSWPVIQLTEDFKPIGALAIVSLGRQRKKGTQIFGQGKGSRGTTIAKEIWEKACWVYPWAFCALHDALGTLKDVNPSGLKSNPKSRDAQAGSSRLCTWEVLSVRVAHGGGVSEDEGAAAACAVALACSSRSASKHELTEVDDLLLQLGKLCSCFADEQLQLLLVCLLAGQFAFQLRLLALALVNAGREVMHLRRERPAGNNAPFELISFTYELVAGPHDSCILEGAEGLEGGSDLSQPLLLQVLEVRRRSKRAAHGHEGAATRPSLRQHEERRGAVEAVSESRACLSLLSRRGERGAEPGVRQGLGGVGIPAVRPPLARTGVPAGRAEKHRSRRGLNEDARLGLKLRALAAVVLGLVVLGLLVLWLRCGLAALGFLVGPKELREHSELRGATGRGPVPEEGARGCLDVVRRGLGLPAGALGLGGGREDDALAPGRSFMAQRAAEADTKALACGLLYKVLQQGKGQRRPGLTTLCRCRFTASTLAGEPLDESGESGVLLHPGLQKRLVADEQGRRAEAGGSWWSVALRLMVEGDKWQLYVPPELAFGKLGMGAVPPDAFLVVRLELARVLDACPHGAPCPHAWTWRPRVHS
ncbi:unnamed protein product [Prorocentrum cordatum]|uniref:peptidylprolyl isomerase n=1 Tax=Prorocentrum cordatum TaxID=2364126 RepID=A0ABN9U492_9DINO|nr:unnamed protein product [Polarella glacialis]